MTIVMTYLASDNARNRRRAKRAAEREMKQTATRCSDRVLKAVTQAPNWRNKPDDSGAICIPEVAQFAVGYRKKTDSVTAR